MINLEDHKVFVESHKMEMVPYTTAVKALTELSAELNSDKQPTRTKSSNARS